MMNKQRYVTMVLALVLLPCPALADMADKMEKLVGYAIVDSKTIDGWSEDGKTKDGFEGCSHGRVIIFTDGKGLTCSTYSYSYAYRPTAVILAKQVSYQGRNFYDFKMVVGDEVYDMRAR